MEVIFVDWTPIKHKNNIRYGAHIRRHYAWITLNEIVGKVIPFREKKGSINWKALIKMFRKDSKIWVEYPCGGVAHLLVLLASFIRFKKTLILNVHDTVEQQKYTYGKHPFLKKIRLKIIEHLLINRANIIILPAPGVLDYFRQRKKQKVIIMVPGVGEDELFIPPLKKKKIKNKRTATYFGSIRRRDIIHRIIELFTALDDWELLLIGQKEGAKIEEKENVKYLGIVSHDKLQAILDDSDVILIPDVYINEDHAIEKDYSERGIPIKLGYALKSCKPVITTNLKGISEYVSMVGLEENVIYVKEWNLDSLKDALQRAQNLSIDAEKTIQRLRPLAWEPRFRKVIEIVLDRDHRNHDEIEWI